jgi:hypothetical protein
MQTNQDRACGTGIQLRHPHPSPQSLGIRPPRPENNGRKWAKNGFRFIGHFGINRVKAAFLKFRFTVSPLYTETMKRKF